MIVRQLKELPTDRGWLDAWSNLASGESVESIFLGPDWYAALLGAHGDQVAHEILVVEEEGEPVAIWPLHRGRGRKNGVLPYRSIEDASAWYVPHSGIASRGDPEMIVACCLEHLARDRSWDILGAYNLVEGGVWHSAFVSAAKSRGMVLDSQTRQRSPYLPLEGDWDGYLKSQRKKFRSDLKRCAKKVAEIGEPEIRQTRDRAELVNALEAVLEIERQSWKHEAGCAITSREWETRFYRGLLDSVGSRGWLQITLLFAGGDPIAHDIGLVRDDRYWCLKTSFVERIRASGAGKILRENLVRAQFERGVKEHDLLGEDEPWKMQWTDRTRAHMHLTLFRSRAFAAATRGVDRLTGLYRKLTRKNRESEASSA